MTWRDHPLAPEPGTKLCKAAEVPDGGVKEVLYGDGRDALRLILVRSGDGIWAYVNRCPHFLIPMNTGTGDFLVTDNILWCGQHSAQFRFEDGHCIDGPCKGGDLEPVALRIDGDTLAIG